VVFHIGGDAFYWIAVWPALFLRLLLQKLVVVVIRFSGGRGKRQQTCPHHLCGVPLTGLMVEAIVSVQQGILPTTDRVHPVRRKRANDLYIQLIRVFGVWQKWHRI
jgi:hypothetical protein